MLQNRPALPDSSVCYVRGLLFFTPEVRESSTILYSLFRVDLPIMTELVEEQTEHPIRQVFIVSDGTAITAETLAHAITTQFPDLEYQQTRMPFVNTVEKAQAAADAINRIGIESGTRPIIFTTFVEPDIMRTFNEHVQGHIIDLFRKFVGPLETELGMKCAHSVGQSHRIRDDERYNKRIAAIDYTLQHDDGQTNRGLDEADVILVGVSRSGKTPTSLFLAMQYGIKVANYPLIPEDFERGSLPDALLPLRHKLFGLSIRPERLSEIRNERRPGSRYASIENCREEIFDAENLMRREGIRWLNSTTKSIEEISATIMSDLGLDKRKA